jgi:hypothetical protein
MRLLLLATLLLLTACATAPRGSDITLPAPPPVRY